MFIISDAILDNRKELIKIFNNIEDKINNTITDSELILMAYRKWGEDCPKYLLGDFNFVYLMKKKKSYFV